jgi:hypothetical protein
MAIDFSKLSRPTSAAEREEADARRRAQEIERDKARRLEHSHKSVVITLERDAETRFHVDGSQVIHLHGLQDDQKPVHATWYAPDYLSRAETHAIILPLTEGAKVKLGGYWKRLDTDRGIPFVFRAQILTPL